MRDRREIVKEIDDISRSTSADIHRQIEALHLTYGIMQGNREELLSYLRDRSFTAQAIELFADNTKLMPALREVLRRFHNFLASAKTLVDHTRVAVQRLYGDHEFLAQYQARVSQDLANSDLQIFIQDLRNYTQHYTIPVVGMTLSWDATRTDHQFSSVFNIDRDGLLKDYTWKPGARRYLDSHADKIPLDKLAAEYYLLISKFYEWLGQQQGQLHQRDFDRVNRRLEELKEELRQTGIDV